MKLGKDCTIEKKNGFDYVIKPIPDSDAAGELDPRVYDVVKQMPDESGSMAQMPSSEEEVKAFVQGMRAMMGWDNTDVTKTTITTTRTTIDGTYGPIPLHIYTPSIPGKLPAVVFFHGGGFFGGSTKVVENPCKALAEKAGAVVVSVDYRLAPEHAFPAGLTDCFDAVAWVHNHAEEIRVNPQQIAVSGDSAGGNLATVCALLDIEKGTGMIKFQALIYPTVNMGGLATDEYEWSIDQYDIRNHEALILRLVNGLKDSGGLILPIYLQNHVEPGDPRVSPLFSDRLGDMPPTLIAVAQYDYLTIECEAYAAKLARLGVPVRLIRYNGTDHAFMDKIGLYPQAEDLMNEIAKEMKRWFA